MALYTNAMGIMDALTKPKARTVCGIDASTRSIAFAILDDGKPVKCVEVMLNGATVFERLKDAKVKTRALVEAGILRADYVAIEAAIMVSNVQTAIKLAYIYGAILSEVMALNPEVHEVAPISWQSGIGNPNLKKEEKEAIKKEFPGKSESWYKNKGREIRKDRTMNIAREYFDIPSDSDNMGDAVGLAIFVDKVLTR